MDGYNEKTRGSAMPYQDLILEHRGAVSWLYLNRPQALNALSMRCMRELRAALIELRDRDETRVIVLSGKGRGFCAGADLTGALPDRSAPPSGEPTFDDLGTAMEEVLNAMPKPVIAAVNGVAAGGGLEIAMMSDFIVAAASARLGDAHANFGAMPGGGATVRLPRFVGVSQARYLMFTGELMSAEEALRVGLVTKVWPDEAFEAEAQALAEKIAAKSPLGLKRMKALINGSFDMSTDQAVRLEKAVSAQHMLSFDAEEGGKAFAEKRKPAFRGY
jgi:enoyl-CoA hydratase/carnithine racemase